jgi:NTE family protein/lysophospholipid hydrolase
VKPNDPITELSIFSELTPETIQALSANLETVHLSASAVLFRQGDPGEAFYVITSGKLRLSLRQPDGLVTQISDLGPGETVGEMAVLTGQPHPATVNAVEETRLLRLPKAAFDRLAQVHPDLITRLIGAMLPRFQQTRTNLILTRLFGPLEQATLAELGKSLAWRRLDCGQVLCRQGEPGEELYIVVQGRLHFTVETAGETRTLGEVGAGESIGEFALLAESGTPESLRSATVSATRVTDVIVMTRPVFENLLRQHPQILLNLTRRIIRRELQITQSTVPGMSALVIAVLPTHPRQMLGDFPRQLAEAFGALGTTQVWNPERFDELYGKPGDAQTPLDHPTSLLINAWLDEHERRHQYVIYEVPLPLDDAGQLTPWARRCAEDADILLLVGDDRLDPAPTAVEAGLATAQTRARLELALVHPAGCPMPSGTLRWLTPRHAGAAPLRAHHHLRLGRPDDFRRLARQLSRQPLGLTLGGGGARGWAHIGAIRALEEAGFEADRVGGASMGAIIAAGYACDWSVEQMNQLAVQFSNPKKLLDYTLPYASITATRRISTLLQTLFGESQIEDAWRPYFCISANLTRGEEQTHASGPIWKAVRASMAFPAIFAPIYEDGCVLIDGGAANNVPVDRMREFCPNGTVIGVELETGSPVNGQYNFGSSLSGWEVLLSRLNPFAREVKAPNLLDIVGGIVYSNNRYRLNEVWRSADLLVRVPVEAYGLLDFDRYPQIIEAGYTATRAQIQGFALK